MRTEFCRVRDFYCMEIMILGTQSNCMVMLMGIEFEMTSLKYSLILMNDFMPRCQISLPLLYPELKADVSFCLFDFCTLHPTCCAHHR